ncbi:MAG: hypothetical protein BGO97_09530 [Micrococcales bacterium 70-64]|nr:helix-turn-helix transcriptional regulator [Leifsonia sp.]ODU65461.1 MAG: hypothetical protein ABT06_09535 [Leifsonia sp. SCN 70-46]OJX85936.1 MAG: hypothetical protein BGO97_09530 [Micrococcales bacterium 70-64]
MSRKPATVAELAFGKAVGASLAERRTSLGMSGADLARQSGVSLDSIRSIETGRVSNPGLYTVALIAHAVGITLDQLVTPVDKRADTLE